eukprot:678392-Prymnesium_polylepis.1
MRRSTPTTRKTKHNEEVGPCRAGRPSRVERRAVARDQERLLPPNFVRSSLGPRARLRTTSRRSTQPQRERGMPSQHGCALVQKQWDGTIRRGVETRSTVMRRAAKHGIREYAGIRHIL